MKDEVKKEEKTMVKSKIAEREEEILRYWQERDIFKKSLEKDAPNGDFVFYDGPPFATGTPHFGHILASTIKDAIPRYQTMKGKHVARRWGWDCHGLPIENIVEKDLGVSGRKQIEALGVKEFNEHARSKVLTYVHEWKKTVERIGRWVDFDGSYKTMDNTYIESVWWALKELDKKDVIYESTKVLPYCPRCETPIANSEIAMDNSYKDISDISVYVKFELVDEPGTFVIAWTTTPWTLPGNFALAVNPEIEYVKVKIGESYFIIAEARLSVVKEKYEIFEKIQGSDLVGKSYKPPFDYFLKSKIKDIDRAWKIYGGSFVTTTDGTGVVHIAPGYGEDDMALAKEEHIPFIHHVNPDGTFTHDVTDFSGLLVKPKDTKENPTNHQSSDILIIKYLANKNLLFDKAKIVHSYPHCYRCETPLYYYAIPSWFIKIADVKEQVLKTNEEINWVPSHLKYGRYAKTVENAPDWNISRNRYWASPLPIWKCDMCKQVEFLGSIDDIKKKTSRGNVYFTVRHGEAENNVLHIESSNPKTPHLLTEKGREQASEAAEIIATKEIDVMYCSLFPRAKETAEIIAEKIGFPKEKIIYDGRINEINVGALDGKLADEYSKFFTSQEEKFVKAAEGGETYTDVKNRTAVFLYEIDKRYSDKKILIVSHNVAIWLLTSGALGLTDTQALAIRPKHDFIENSEVKTLIFAPIPHNDNYELDLHRPYIDDITFSCDCGGIKKRIPEVIDCWFESGSMPFASNHYPFETDTFHPKAGLFTKALNFPAQFVAEYVAQTRTWFYYTHVVSLFLFEKIPFENIVVTGTILAEDGEKMSKRLKNYSDPEDLVDVYGADAIRYYLLSSPVMKAEDLNFANKGVDEVMKKIIMRLQNVFSFFEMYGGFDAKITDEVSENVLDVWVLIRLKELATEVTRSMDVYELDRATRPIMGFVDDISTWFLRRSRDRFKSEDPKDRANAMRTTRTVILELSKLIAPSMPFLAEDLYLKITGGLEKESVHLENWPEKYVGTVTSSEEKILGNMKEVRNLVSLGLEARAKAGIKVRQPLQKIIVKSETLKANAEYFQLILDEVNVKEIVFDESNVNEVELDTNITEKLREEGIMRDIVRAIQEMRKNKKLNPEDTVNLVVDADEAGVKLFEKFNDEISKLTGLKEMRFETIDGGELLDIDGFKIRLLLD